MRQRHIATWLTAVFFCVAAAFIRADAQVIGGVGGSDGGASDPLNWLNITSHDFTMTPTEMDSAFGGTLSGSSLGVAGAYATFYRADSDFTADQTWIANQYAVAGEAYRLEIWDLGVNTVVDDSVFPANMGTDTPVFTSTVATDWTCVQPTDQWMVWEHDNVAFTAGHVYAFVVIADPENPADNHDSTSPTVSAPTFPAGSLLDPVKRVADTNGSWFNITDWDADPTVGTWVNNSSTMPMVLRIDDEGSSLNPVEELRLDNTLTGEYTDVGNILELAASPPRLRAGDGAASETRHTFWDTADPTGSITASGSTDRAVQWVRSKSAMSWLGIEVGIDATERGFTYNIYVTDWSGDVILAEVEGITDAGSGDEYVRFDFDEPFTTEVDGYYRVIVQRTTPSSSYDYLVVGSANASDSDRTDWEVISFMRGVSPDVPIGYGAGSAADQYRQAWAFITGDDGTDPVTKITFGSGLSAALDGTRLDVTAAGGGSVALNEILDPTAATVLDLGTHNLEIDGSAGAVITLRGDILQSDGNVALGGNLSAVDGTFTGDGEIQGFLMNTNLVDLGEDPFLATTGADFGVTTIGDVSQIGNGTRIEIDDVLQEIRMYGSVGGSGTDIVAGDAIFVSSLNIPNGATDATLANAGEVHFNTTDEQLSFHSAADGEISGEASISLIQHFSITFDPAAVCEGDVDRLFLMTLGDQAPEGIIIDEWKVSFEADPTTEADLDFKYADAFIGVANAAVIDVADTTAGVASEDTDANINGGAAVANGKVLYLEFGTAYTETGHQMIFEFWYHCEED